MNYNEKYEHANLILWYNFQENSGIKSRNNNGSLTPGQRGHEGRHDSIDMIEWQQTELNDTLTLTEQLRWTTYTHNTYIYVVAHSELIYDVLSVDYMYIISYIGWLYAIWMLVKQKTQNIGKITSMLWQTGKATALVIFYFILLWNSCKST